MKKTIILASSLLLLTACEEGGSFSDLGDISAAGFDYIEADGNFDIYYTQGDYTSVQTSGKDASAIKANLNGSIVHFYSTDGTTGSEDFDIYVTTPTLKGIIWGGNGTFQSENPVSAEDMEILVAGEGDVNLGGLTCNEFTAMVTNSGNLIIGQTSVMTLKAESSGEGDIHLRNADINSAVLTVNGEGDITIEGRVGHYEEHTNGTGSVNILQ